MDATLPLKPRRTRRRSRYRRAVPPKENRTSGGRWQNGCFVQLVETSPRGDLREASLHRVAVAATDVSPALNSSLRWDLQAKTMILIVPFQKQRKGATVRVR
jgi:hypothetical protein